MLKPCGLLPELSQCSNTSLQPINVLSSFLVQGREAVRSPGSVLGSTLHSLCASKHHLVSVQQNFNALLSSERVGCVLGTPREESQDHRITGS